ncbi:MAG: tRNA preQ1(34) S-adenosylmethionine ribosyltransferase-isomerase QueA [Phycisphaerales bacterium]|nr:tRNA preQ1(34) S-adenosylmethionine ribosyltransferase-isomerase QueA [Phycisphaerales bacterium]
MRRDELHYELPPELIAQQPITPRDAARLLVLHRDTGRIEHRTFRDLGAYLDPGDCLVTNDTRVIPARFDLERATGGRIEALFLRVDSTPAPAPGAAEWICLLKSAGRLRPGETLACRGHPTHLQAVARLERGAWRLRPDPHIDPLTLLSAIGAPPLPPYIRRGVKTEPTVRARDHERYQTVYATHPGAVAAPTAGLHFTPELLTELGARGVERVPVTLHVGLGTFAPIEVEDLQDHPMHAEWYEVRSDALTALRACRARGGRIVAVGTTAVRVLESLPEGVWADAAAAFSGWTRLFLYPPYRFRHVDRLLTNFHLPESTLLALVMAFGTRAQVRAAYAAAVAERYRFFSYGDAMLIL